jgi:hypothetical protein
MAAGGSCSCCVDLEQEQTRAPSTHVAAAPAAAQREHSLLQQQRRHNGSTACCSTSGGTMGTQPAAAAAAAGVRCCWDAHSQPAAAGGMCHGAVRCQQQLHSCQTAAHAAAPALRAPCRTADTSGPVQCSLRTAGGDVRRACARHARMRFTGGCSPVPVHRPGSLTVCWDRANKPSV